MRSCLAALVAFALSGCATSRPSQPLGGPFSQLQPGEQIKIHFISQGCFRTVAYDFAFERNTATTVRIWSLKPSRNASTESLEYHALKPLGTLTLTSRDIQGLDRLIRFYQSHPEGRCTTVDKITISHIRDGRVIAENHYVDQSCDASNSRHITALPSLVRRLER